MAPRGVATAVAMIIVGRLVGKVDVRWLIGAGMVLGAIGSWAMTHYSLEVSTFWIWFNPAVVAYLKSLHLSPTDPHAMAVIAAQIGQQAEMTALVDVFKLTAWSFVAMMPLVLLLRKGRKG